jgi:hypothetical protein
MNKSTKPFSLVIMLLLTFALVSCKKFAGTGFEPGIKTVVLLVNTEDIRPGEDPKEYCSFPDQNGDIQQYTTRVAPGDTVVWIGVSPTLEHEVEIKKIIHQGGPNVLGPTRGSKGKVEGKIKDSAKHRQEERYMIQFRVIKPGGQPNTYTLDPILRVHAN